MSIRSKLQNVLNVVGQKIGLRVVFVLKIVKFSQKTQKGKGNSKMKKQTFEKLEKWYVRDNLHRLMLEGAKLRYALPNGDKTIATIVSTKVVSGKVRFATSSEPYNYAYLGGKGWELVTEKEVSLQERIDTFVEDAGLSPEGEEAFRDIVAELQS